MEFASISAMNVLLIGPPGCGKTSLINDFLDQQGIYHLSVYAVLNFQQLSEFQFLTSVLHKAKLYCILTFVKSVRVYLVTDD